MSTLFEISKADSLQTLGINPTVTRISNARLEYVKFDSCEEMITKIRKGITEYGWNHGGLRDTKAYKAGTIDRWTFGSLQSYDRTKQSLIEGRPSDLTLKNASSIYNEILENPTVKQLFEKASSYKRRRKYCDDGAELCMDRVLAGDPEHWTKTIRGKQNPLIKLGVNINGLANEEEQRYSNITALSGVITDILLKAGFSVELSSCSTSMYSTSSGGYFTTIVGMKQAEEKLDLNRIFSFGCSGFFRCWNFQVKANIFSGRVSGGIGVSVPVPNEFLPELGFDYLIDSNFIGRDGKANVLKIENMLNQIIKL